MGLADSIFHTLPLPLIAVAKLFCNNKPTIYTVTNYVFHERTNHVEVDCHIVQNQLKTGTLNVIHVTNDIQLADILSFILVYSVHCLVVCLSQVFIFFRLQTKACRNVLHIVYVS